MAACGVRGNEYGGSFAVITGDRTARIFDSIECAVHAIVSACVHRGCCVLGSGVQRQDEISCCAHSARQAGTDAVRDYA
ncbi:Rieske 2Fe-2S domain-containing protein [Kribbella sp. NPDC004536]|uniref:Rieske 2Fe-2S domain-containing protein n=1 Tax=Kribbella sp. NPDC004536 TaxID=3364106 RepID=UPI0036902718